ncbi:polysaccharide biosynthesis protein [Nocardioides sp. B-3]|uniref:polysaccharide biosynthesis protein n=1 Tax=Nocardioides sp. B-3 TaxID=2895565 RepID=UPI003FA5F1BD
MIDLSGRGHVEITFTGLRPGEKLSEVLFSDDEEPQPTEHPLIRSVQVPPLSPSQLTGLAMDRPDVHTSND